MGLDQTPPLGPEFNKTQPTLQQQNDLLLKQLPEAECSAFREFQKRHEEPRNERHEEHATFRDRDIERAAKIQFTVLKMQERHALRIKGARPRPDHVLQGQAEAHAVAQVDLAQKQDKEGLEEYFRTVDNNYLRMRSAQLVKSEDGQEKERDRQGGMHKNAENGKGSESEAERKKNDRDNDGGRG